MIVSINDNNRNDYSDIFAEAYRLLKDNGFDVDPNKTNFSSLTEYYGHIADLFSLQKYRYVMLPLDEEPFTINLNDRSITVPASFSKCASVQTDLLAENIVFVADRYFDYMDLANTNIYVQWIAGGVHGATFIEMIDLESQPDKIRFAWPLSEKITEKPGTVKFSVRFLRKDSSSDQIVYSLNTTEKEIVIKPALMPNGPTITENPLTDSNFKKAVINSVYVSEGVSEPLIPTLRAPGSDITINPTNDINKVEADNNFINGNKIVGLENNTITLYAQAVVADGGTLKYEWYYKPENSETVATPCIVKNEDGEIISAFGTVEEKFFRVNDINDEGEVLPVEDRNFPERYYEDEMGLTLYTGEFPADVPLYTKFSAYTVPSGDEAIAGTYSLRVYNVIESGGKVVTTNKWAQSCDCLLPGPQDIVINKDLNDLAVIENEKIDLTMEMLADPYLPNINYTWTRSLKEDMSNSVSTEVTTVPSLAVTEPGWYQAHIVSTLNREEKENYSNICKVTNKPLPPVVVAKTDADYHLSDGEAKLIIDVIENNDGVLPIELLSDKIHYVWQMRPINITDDIWTTIENDSVMFEGQGKDTLTVKSVDPYGGVTFRCLVINELNNQKAIFDHTGKYIPAEDEYFGEFKKEPPYIYENADGVKSDYYYYVFAD